MTTETKDLILDVLYWVNAFVWSIVLLLLVGCATIDPTVAQVRQRAAEGYDAALDAAERIQCQDASVGSIRRRFGKSQDLMSLYNAWCRQDGVLELKE